MYHAGMAKEAHQDAVLANGLGLPVSGGIQYIRHSLMHGHAEKLICCAKQGMFHAGTVEEAHQDGVLANGLGLPDFEDEEDPDELLSDEDAPDLQDEIAKTLTSLKVPFPSPYQERPRQ